MRAGVSPRVGTAPIVTVRGDVPRYSTFFGGCGLIEVDEQREQISDPRRMYRGQCARRMLQSRFTEAQNGFIVHEDGKRERKTIAIYARM